MIIYSSSFLEIDKRDNLLVQKWKDQMLGPEEFKTELLEYDALSRKVRPGKSLWLKEEFNLSIPKNLYQWIRENVLMKQKKIGLCYQAFTIPRKKDVFNSMLDFFEQNNQIVEAHYFQDESCALNHINQSHNGSDDSDDVKVTITENNNATLELNVRSENIQFVNNQINLLLNEKRAFKFLHRGAFESLTMREIEIFNLIITGFSNHEIGDKLSIAKVTVSSHRKSIIQKLGIQNLSDWINYASVFGPTRD